MISHFELIVLRRNHQSKAKLKLIYKNIYLYLVFLILSNLIYKYHYDLCNFIIDKIH